ncbi:hypothetical protein PVW47_18005, partial [Marinovum sp. SP66]|nr:hypothetical protein [Marinovum sp. SP66]
SAPSELAQTLHHGEGFCGGQVTCCNRWGLVIEMLIEAFTYAQLNGDEVCAIDHFEHAYAKAYSAPLGYSPFTMPDYRDGFDHERMMELLLRT